MLKLNLSFQAIVTIVIVVCATFLRPLIVIAFDGERFHDSGVLYSILSEKDKTVEVYVYDRYNGEYASITIPSSVEYNNVQYTVVSLHNRAFEFNDHLVEISIPNTIKEISELCFNNCSVLEKVHLPKDLEEIKKSGFYNCPCLKEIDLPKKLKIIGNNAFTYCGLKSISIPNSVTEIGVAAFGKCIALENVQLPNAIIRLYGTFYECTNLKKILLPQSLEYIDYQSFYGCTELQEVTIPDNVKKIGEQAFENCTKLNYVDLGVKLENIQDNAFANCPLKTIYSRPEKAPLVTSTAFDSRTFEDAVLKIPSNYITSYNTADIWRDFSKMSSIGGDNIFVHSLLISPQSISIRPNEPQKFSVAISPDIATEKKVTWHSDNNNIVKVDDNGDAVGIREGRTTVTATTVDGSNISSSCIVEVLPPIPVTAITLSDTNINLNIDQTFQLQESVLPESASIKTVIWQSSDRSVAEVDNNGLVKAVGIGSAEVLAVSESNPDIKAKCIVEVNPILVSSISLNATSKVLKVGEIFTLVPTVSPTDATNNSVSFTSSNTNITKVNDLGEITAVALGESIVTVTAADGSNVSATCKIVVEATPVESVTISTPSSLILEVGDGLLLTATVLPETATNKAVTWSSSNEAVATVDSNGKVIGVGVGECKITAMSNDGTNISHECIIKVVATTISSVVITANGSTNLKVGESVQLVATVTPENATNKNMRWSTSDERIATVDADGKVTAIGIGTCHIAATTTDGSGICATCKIVVEATPVESVTISTPSSPILKVGDVLLLTATVSPTTATDNSVIWTSSNKGVASINENGLVTALSVGSTVITAETDGKKDKLTIIVEKTLAESIILSRSNVVLKVGGEMTLAATVYPVTTTNKDVIWTSSNSSLVTVDNAGNIYALTLGECDVIATATDGSNVSSTCHVKVETTFAEGIYIYPRDPIQLKIGETMQLTAIVIPENATDKSVMWESQSDAVIVDAKGLITAKFEVVNNWIKATNSAGQSDIVYVTVMPVKVENIILDKTSVTLKVDETTSLSATALPQNATNKAILFSSNDPSIATVDAKGTIKAVAIGETQILATAIDGSGVTAECNVKVEITPVESILIEANGSTTLKPGETIQLFAMVLPTTATDKTVKWISSNPRVAEIDNDGLVTAISIGSTVITAIVGGLKSEIIITVAPILVETIELNQYELALDEGEIGTIVATVFPNEATNIGIEWKSSNMFVASIQDGVVLGIKPGTAAITASSVDGSGVKAECVVTVKEKNGIESINGNDVKVFVIGNTLYVNDLPINEIVRIIQPNGTEIYSEESTGSDLTFTFENKGFYIILVGAKSYKVAVR